MRNGNERKSLSSSSPLDCDVGLGLKMPLQPSDEPFFSNTGNQVGCGGHIYEPAADTFVLRRGFHSTAFRTPGVSMAVSGKALFTASQWQELERQKMIHKYIMASIPVPPQLLLPISSNRSFSQSNTSPSLDFRYSSTGSDPEPWRCKRTDGKKWRCSRDVAPDQKYCERHAHKTRTRSRKHVEISSSHNTNNSSTQRSSSSSSHQSISTIPSATSYDQTSSIDWFMRGGSSSSMSNQQQWQQLMQQLSSSSSSSSRFELNKDDNKNVSLHQPQSFMNLNPYKMGSSSQSETATRHFIDAWEKESLSNKFSPISSSLTLSMSGGDDHGNEIIGTMMNSDRDNEYGILRGVSWNNSSPPGGPLGEALCLGNNATSTTNSSKSSCEEGSYALNFIG